MRCTDASSAKRPSLFSLTPMQNPVILTPPPLQTPALSEHIKNAPANGMPEPSVRIEDAPATVVQNPVMEKCILKLNLQKAIRDCS